MSTTQQIEKILETASLELEEVREKLASVGVIWSKPEVVVGETSEKGPTAEVQIWFYKDEEPVDFLEFFALRDGVPAAPEAELRDWIRESCSDIVKRLQQKNLPSPLESE